MANIREICEFLEALAPARLAEDWDNVGLLVGDPTRAARRVMTCLTVTMDSAREAVQEQVDLIVTHHPLPFRPLHRLTVETTAGRLLWELIGRGSRSTVRTRHGIRPAKGSTSNWRSDWVSTRSSRWSLPIRCSRQKAVDVGDPCRSPNRWPS